MLFRSSGTSKGWFDEILGATSKITRGTRALPVSNSPRHRFFLRVQFALRPEWFAESVGEIVAVLEIVARVLFGFCQQAAFDHVENDFAKVAAVVHAPFLQHRHGHR